MGDILSLFSSIITDYFLYIYSIYNIVRIQKKLIILYHISYNKTSPFLSYVRPSSNIYLPSPINCMFHMFPICTIYLIYFNYPNVLYFLCILCPPLVLPFICLVHLPNIQYIPCILYLPCMAHIIIFSIFFIFYVP